MSTANKAYEALVESKKLGGEGFHAQHAQTLNNPAKTKEILALPADVTSVGVNANEWAIYDSFAEPAVGEDAALA